MKWYISRRNKKSNSYKWKKVFLWKPTRISDDCVAWLEWYERQENPAHLTGLIKTSLRSKRYNYRRPE